MEDAELLLSQLKEAQYLLSRFREFCVGNEWNFLSVTKQILQMKERELDAKIKELVNSVVRYQPLLSAGIEENELTR